MTTPTIWKFSGSLDHSRSLGMLCLGGLGGNDFSKDLPNAVTFEVHLPQSNRENHHLLLTCFEAHHLWLLNLPPLSYLNKALPKPYFGGLGGGWSFLLHLLHKFHPLGIRFAMTPVFSDSSEFLGDVPNPKMMFLFSNHWGIVHTSHPVLSILRVHHPEHP